MVEYSWSQVIWLPRLATLALFLSIVVPYIKTVAEQRLLSFLPYVSHASAFPPQSAIHSILMTIGAFFGLATFIFRFASVEHRRHALEAKKIPRLNRVALVIGVIANLSLVVASHYPPGFITHDRYDWINNVIVPHFFGLALLVTSFTIYILTQSYLTYAQRRRSDAINVSVHATLAMGIIITNWTSCLPFYAAMRDMLPKIINEETGEINLEQQEYSFYYIISSLSSWVFIIFALLFIFSFCSDLKRMKVTINLSPKLIHIDTVQPPPHQFPEIANNNQNGQSHTPLPTIDEMTKM